MLVKILLRGTIYYQALFSEETKACCSKIRSKVTTTSPKSKTNFQAELLSDFIAPESSTCPLH